MKDIVSKVSREDMENARIDRNRATNPADVEPGMDDFDWGDDSDFGGGSSSGGWGSNLGNDGGFSGPFGNTGGFGGGFGSSGFGGGFGSGFGGGGFGSGFGGGFGQQETPNQNPEEKFWEVAKKVGKGFFTFSSEFVNSFKFFNVPIGVKTGKSIIVSSILVSVLGLILVLFGFGRELGMQMLISGLVSLGLGVVCFMWFYDEFVKNGYSNSQPEPEFQGFENNSNFDDFGDFNSGFDGLNSIEPNEDEEYFDMFDDDEEEFEAFGVEDDVDFSAFEEEETSLEEVEKNMNETLNNLNVDKGMVTRQYLYENITNCLMNVNPNFDKVRVISEDSDEFDAWDAIIQNSANVFKPKGNEVEMPYLISAREKLFYVQLEIKRVNWLKNIDAFVNEIVSICRFDPNTGKTDMNIYGVGTTVGDKIFVKIMKGESTMVTVKDAYKAVESEIKNSKNYMPVVLGLDAEGNVVWRDFKDINAILITGMPRSGKTWFVLSVLAQMSFFLKPSELHFYILDPKDQISDFKSIEIPHIRKFVSTDEDILKELRNIVKVEGPRRKKIIGDAGFVNIWDFKRKNPDVEMPLLYVVIDEVITLAERMDKEVKEEFQALLLELVSQLPALGIRIFMIPHVVKDQILKKSITDLIPCRISVRGDAEHIEKSVGVKNFKHRLIHQGDMAVRFNNDEPIFVRSAVLTNSNEANQDLFDFLLKFWGKIEPESLNGSLHQKRQMELKNNSFSNKSDNYITFEVPKSENVVSVKGDKNKLSLEEVNELVKGIRGNNDNDDNDDIDLWED